MELLLFPDPTAFTDWAASQDIHVALNVHPSVANNDPLYSQAQDVAGNTLTTDNGTAGACLGLGQRGPGRVLLRHRRPDAERCREDLARLVLRRQRRVLAPGVTPDAWINYLTAQQMVNDGERGFDLSRIGASYQNSQAGAYPSGPWADHRSAIAFTGDTQGTWNTLASEAQLAPGRGQHRRAVRQRRHRQLPRQNTTGNGNDPDDLYLRWLQLGTFQPIMREHSNYWGQNARLPWEYDAATQAVGDQFLQLREELVPYLYTLADQAEQHRPADDPGALPRLSRPGRRLHQPRPSTCSARTCWSPRSPSPAPASPPRSGSRPAPGRTTSPAPPSPAPAPQTINVPTSRMPVFVKAGGIIPLQPATGHAQTAGHRADHPPGPRRRQRHATRCTTTPGTGLGYQSGQSAQTPISYTENASADTSTLTICPATGSYPGEPSSRTYTLDLVDESRPTSVQINGQTLAASAWTYNCADQHPAGPARRGRDRREPHRHPDRRHPRAALGADHPGDHLRLARPRPRPASRSRSPAAASARARASSYLTFSDNGTNWGAPRDQATFTIDSWSDSAITFTVPQPQRHERTVGRDPRHHRHASP